MHIQFDNDTSTVCVNVEICLLSITHTCSNVNTLSGLKNQNVYNCLSLNSCCLSWVNEMNWIRYTGTCTVPVYVLFFVFLVFFKFFFLSFLSHVEGWNVGSIIIIIICWHNSHLSFGDSCVWECMCMCYL